MRLMSCLCLVFISALVAAADKPWGAEEFQLISGPASPPVRLAVRLEGQQLALAIEAAELPNSQAAVRVGVAAVKTKIIDAQSDKTASARSGSQRFLATIPASELITSAVEWKRLRIGVAVQWNGGPEQQARVRERYRHTGGATHLGLADNPQLWLPFDLEENATQVQDRRNRIVVPITQALDGKATVVIESVDGKRLRNLIGGVDMAKGAHDVAWDGCDDEGQPLPPGTYHWRALHHAGLTPRYLMSFGNGDNTPDDFKGWGPNHTILTAATAAGKWTVVASPMTEGGDNILVLNADGSKNQGHNSPTGMGMWSISPAIIGDVLYAANDGMGWGDHFDASKKDAIGHLKISLARFDLHNQRLVEYNGKRFIELYSAEVGPGAADKDYEQVSLTGMAAYAERLYIGNKRLQALMVVNPNDGTVIDKIPVINPGVLTASKEALFGVSDGAVVRIDPSTKQLTVIIKKGVCDPRGLAIDQQGRFIITDGTTHTLRIFAANGREIKQLGTPGGYYVGAYDMNRLVNPRGVAVAANGWVWVAEDRANPKRITAWDIERGRVVCEKHGTPAYGGSGCGVDARDHSRWLGLGCQWQVDVDKGTAVPTHVLGKDDHPLHYRYVYQFGLTWVIAIQSTTGVYLQNKDGSLRHVAEIGSNHRFYHYHERKPPQGFIEGFNRAFPDRVGKYEEKGPGFLWRDSNGNGEMDSDEFEFTTEVKDFAGGYWGHDVGPDLTLRIPILLNNDCRILKLVPTAVKDGVPNYPTLAAAIPTAISIDLDRTQIETWVDRFGNVMANSDPYMKAFAPDGSLRWTYPNQWSNVHGSHKAPLPETGVLQGSLFALGTAPLDERSDIFIMVGNHGRYFAMTSDGLYIDEFFKDVRMGGSRDANYIGGEAFGGNFIQSQKDKKYYLQANGYRIYRLDGVDSVTRSHGILTLTQAQAIAAERVRANRQAAAATPRIAIIPYRSAAPTIDGKDKEWSASPTATWAKSGQFKVETNLAYDDKNLYVCWRVNDPSPWINTGKDWTLLFKTGDSVDLQLGTDASANPKRSGPVPGDLRLLIAPSDGKNIAVLYRHRVPGATEPVTFTCPWRAEKVDEVKQLTSAIIGVEVGRDKYCVEVAIPLADLGLTIDNKTRRFDIGALFGDPQGTATSLRSYWANQNTGLVNDVPGEIMLFPNLWGSMSMGGK